MTRRVTFEAEVRGAAEKWVLQNAIQYGGRPNAKAVLGRLMAERPEWRARAGDLTAIVTACLLYTSPSPRDISGSRMPSSA